METECTKSEIKKHCWHTGSGSDTVTASGGYSRTNFMCCWCGETKVEEHTWEHNDTPHGPHKYLPYQPIIPNTGATPWPITLTPLTPTINISTSEVCAIEEFFKANPNATSCNIACFCSKHAFHCSY